ncbi:MAG: hypothetical protein HOP15_18870 [Planctomycetes bacterium]|nr:hypothetical protein [Planctomycetota bacterium]
MAKKKTIRTVIAPPDTTPQEFDLLRRAAANQEDTRQAVRKLLARRPALVAAVSTTASELEDALIDRAGGQGVLAHESMRAELEQMRASLRLPDDGALEELLISQVVLCWLNLLTAERRRTERWSDGISYESGDFWDRHVARLRTDYLRAIRSLASVRRILFPVLQVNIADQQVNQVRR